VIARFVDRHGEGLHHVCLEVPELEPAVERLKQRGLRLVGDGVRTGAEGARVAFVHPRDASGVLLELRQKP
jgi:lactoylglutathione lyase/methylmalonyl-CoA/ethylmalonyl-CoA epimerase